jgi:hypothetical protein
LRSILAVIGSPWKVLGTSYSLDKYKMVMASALHLKMKLIYYKPGLFSSPIFGRGFRGEGQEGVMNPAWIEYNSR